MATGSRCDRSRWTRSCLRPRPRAGSACRRGEHGTGPRRSRGRISRSPRMSISLQPRGPCPAASPCGLMCGSPVGSCSSPPSRGPMATNACWRFVPVHGISLRCRASSRRNRISRKPAAGHATVPSARNDCCAGTSPSPPGCGADEGRPVVTGCGSRRRGSPLPPWRCLPSAPQSRRPCSGRSTSTSLWPRLVKCSNSRACRSLARLMGGSIWHGSRPPPHPTPRSRPACRILNCRDPADPRGGMRNSRSRPRGLAAWPGPRC